MLLPACWQVLIVVAEVLGAVRVLGAGRPALHRHCIQVIVELPRDVRYEAVLPYSVVVTQAAAQ
jgi:hypothetical protein